MDAQKKKHRILVVDDDLVVIRLLETILKAQGYDVIPAEEAPVGLQLAMKMVPDLIILDVMMPVINGFNVCRLLKSQDSHRHIPIILLTSRASPQDQQIGHEVGADAYMAKPLNTEEFLKTVRELLKIA